MPIPNGKEGGIVPPHSVLAPESALRSVPTVALSSAQVKIVLGGEQVDRHCSSNSVGVR